MNPLPPVAILTTLYARDSLPFAKEALASIANQTYPADLIRIYLYVDGPVPESHETFLEENRRTFFRLIRNDTNRGLAIGLNVLLDALQDETYVFRMDLDDLSLPTRLEKQVAFMQANPEIDLCGCNSFEIDDQARPINRRDYPETHESIVARLPRCNPVLHPTYCIRRSSLVAKPIRYPHYLLNEDLGFVFFAAKHGWRLHNLQERLFCWRTGAKFFKRRTLKRSWTEFCIYIQGCWWLWGPSFRLLWPIVRLFTRLAPDFLTHRIYRSSLRNSLLK